MKWKTHREFFTECEKEGKVIKNEYLKVMSCGHTRNNEGICTSKTCPKKMDWLVDKVQELSGETINKADIEAAVESKIIEYDHKLRQVLNGEIECAGSIGLLADEIVDIVLKKMNGEEVIVKKPWEHFKVEK